MQVKVIFTAVLVVAVVLSAGKTEAQVAPSARVGGLPITVGIGISSFNLDYGPGRRMEGPVVRGGATLFHGIGIDVSARALFMFTPSQLTRMQQNTFLGGVYYQAPAYHRVRPFVRMAAGLGVIEFPSNNPKYTRDSYSVYAPSGGAEYQLTSKFALRGEYEYQFWQKFQGPNDLTPQGFTIGVSYSLRSRHLRPHTLD